MSDLAVVYVIVPAQLKKTVTDLLDWPDWDQKDPIFAGIPDLPFELITLEYHEVKYGWFAPIDSEHVLTKGKIPFDFYWDATTESEAGSTSGRMLSNGEFVETTYNLPDKAPSMPEMLRLIENDQLNELATLIKDHAKDRIPIDWATQEQHIKELLMDQLLEG